MLMQRGGHHVAQRFLRLALRQDPLSWKAGMLSVLNLAHVRV
jgi:hypothetical protein